MTALLVGVAMVSCAIAGVAVALAICATTEAPCRVIPGRFVAKDGRSMESESGNASARDDNPPRLSPIERPSVATETFR